MFMLYAILTTSAFGLLAGLGLGFASRKFNVERDVRREQILELLPGINCGACGQPGCSAMADAIIAGSARPDMCASSSSKVIVEIARIMGVTITLAERRVATLICNGDLEACPRVADYKDIKDCRLMSVVAGGGKTCIYGCLGGGTCTTACIYGAISVGDNGIAQIDEDKCIGCGLCAKICPRGLIRLLQKNKDLYVACSSKDSGVVVRKSCSGGCIGCKMCEKACPQWAIKVENNLSVIDHSKCVKCGVCLEKCPTKAIKNRKIGLLHANKVA